jgi:DNA-binding transcriptional regulator of glucitol operon
MLKFNWFISFLSFFAIAIAEDGGGSTVEESSQDEQQEEAQSTEEAVLDAIGLGEEEPSAEGGQVDAPNADEKPAEADAPVENKPEVEQAEKKHDGLTDADLAPLDSKNPKTNERFQKVTEGYKQEKAQRESLQAEVSRYQQSFDSLRQLGYADEGAAHDLVNFSEYRKAIYSGDENTFSKIISDQIKQFESLYGKKISISSSALDDHPDLKEKVDALDIDESTALELVRSRELQARINREAQNRTQAQQTEAERTQELSGVVASVEQLQENWQRNDPDFPAILPHLQPLMAEIGSKYPPALWPQLLELQYKSLKKALSESQSASRGNNTPLRGNGRQGAKPAPSSPQEAVLQELGLDGD